MSIGIIFSFWRLTRRTTDSLLQTFESMLMSGTCAVHVSFEIFRPLLFSVPSPRNTDIRTHENTHTHIHTQTKSPVDLMGKLFHNHVIYTPLSWSQYLDFPFGKFPEITPFHNKELFLCQKYIWNLSAGIISSKMEFENEYLCHVWKKHYLCVNCVKIPSCLRH